MGNVERSGNGADRLPVSDEFLGQFLLVWPHFLWPPEGDAARLGGKSAIACWVGRPICAKLHGSVLHAMSWGGLAMAGQLASKA
jgi:hypothetical protein